MLERFFLFSALLLVGAASIVISGQMSIGQTIGKENDTSLVDNASSLIAENNTILLNATEVGDEEQLRWTDSSGAENPTLNIVANNEYTIKISNPTHEEHELIVTSESDGKTTTIAKSPEIKPGEDGEFKFMAVQTGELGYHCEYHPDMMNGTITVTE